jgi:hypothetical protein
MLELKKVVADEVYSSIHSYVCKCGTVVEDYEGMIEVILCMIKDGHCFVMDRDILRDAMESMVYMYAPGDDMNKDRLMQQFVEDDEDDDDDDDEDEGGEEEFGNMDLMKMMQMMGGLPPSGASPDGACPDGSCPDGACPDDACPDGACPYDPACEKGNCGTVADGAVADGAVADGTVADDTVKTEQSA